MKATRNAATTRVAWPGPTSASAARGPKLSTRAVPFAPGNARWTFERVVTLPSVFRTSPSMPIE